LKDLVRFGHRHVEKEQDPGVDQVVRRLERLNIDHDKRAKNLAHLYKHEGDKVLQREVIRKKHFFFMCSLFPTTFSL